MVTTVNMNKFEEACVARQLAHAQDSFTLARVHNNSWTILIRHLGPEGSGNLSKRLKISVNPG